MPIHIFNTFNQPGVFTSGTEAFGINDVGQIVGQYSDLGGTHGFLLSGGIYTTLDDPLGTHGTVATGINNAGQIVGTYVDTNGWIEVGKEQYPIGAPSALQSNAS